MSKQDTRQDDTAQNIYAHEWIGRSVMVSGEGPYFVTDVDVNVGDVMDVRVKGVKIGATTGGGKA